MSGHSKFANIKHKKEKNDAKKGKIFTIIGREIVIAVKEGGPDPANNSKLRDVIAKAKANNMPNDTIDRGDNRAHGTDGSHLDGPGARKVEISVRDMEKEVPHRPNSQTAKGLLTFTRNIFESRDILVERIALGKALRGARHGAQLGHG